MWPFGRPKLDDAQLERIRELERKMAVLEVEWSDWFDRYRRLYAKIAKRAAEVPEPQPEADQAANGQPDAPSSRPVSSSLLSHRRALRGF